MDCTGSESSLSQCSHAGIGNHDCSHIEDVGVRCGKKYDAQPDTCKAKFKLVLLLLQIQRAMIQTFVCLVVADQMKAKWRFVVKECEEVYVVTCGIETMPWWHADSWDYPQKVSVEECMNMPKPQHIMCSNKLCCGYGMFITLSADLLVFQQYVGGDRPVLLRNVTCTGNESSLFDCSHAVVNHPSSCGYGSGEEVHIMCVTGMNGSTTGKQAK